MHSSVLNIDCPKFLPTHNMNILYKEEIFWVKKSSQLNLFFFDLLTVDYNKQGVRCIFN